MLACPASAELPWKSEARGRYDLEPRLYFAVVSVGGVIGYHESENTLGTQREWLDYFGQDTRGVEFRLFQGTAGFGLSLVEIYESVSWNSEWVGAPTLSLLVITRRHRRSFDFAALEIPTELLLPRGAGLSYTVVPIAPLGLECTARAGFYSGEYWTWDDFTRPYSFTSLSWHASVCVRLGLGGWWMSDD